MKKAVRVIALTVIETVAAVANKASEAPATHVTGKGRPGKPQGGIDHVVVVTHRQVHRERVTQDRVVGCVRASLSLIGETTPFAVGLVARSRLRRSLRGSFRAAGRTSPRRGTVRPPPAGRALIFRWSGVATTALSDRVASALCAGETPAITCPGGGMADALA